jgi:hypothetical protein
MTVDHGMAALDKWIAKPNVEGTTVQIKTDTAKRTMALRLRRIKKHKLLRVGKRKEVVVGKLNIQTEGSWERVVLRLALGEMLLQCSRVWVAVE